MGDIAQEAYGKIWGKGEPPSPSHLKSYLHDYHRKLTTHDRTQLAIPSSEALAESIRDTNNSSPGPDGIPFAYYRLFADELAPVLHAILCKLAAGEHPPEGYNHALLHLIPKDDSYLINNTRPISVTNADNRILAKLLARIMGPVLARVLHTNQKGFIPGRNGLDHIRAITERYYTALDSKQQYFILFLDTRKAFDSIHHTFIHATLRKLHIPRWICNVIKGFLTQPKALPVFARTHAIDIHKGVKQGCPLSPLLFAICYDVLLSMLDLTADHLSLAFADDLACGATRLSTILSLLSRIKTFASHSGLGLNIHKTQILSSLPPTAAEQGTVRLFWPKLKFVAKAVYLGVMIGQSITTIDIFQNAMQKFLFRANQLRSIIRPATLHQRITIYNTYLLPIMLYLAQLYIVPYDEIAVPLRDHCRKAIVPFNGTAFSYALLVSPHRSMPGPFTPLRDLWATNMALLGSRYDLSASHTMHNPELGDMHHVTTEHWGSLIPHEHEEAYAAYAFLRHYCPRNANNTLDARAFLPSVALASRRRKLYHCMADIGYSTPRMHRTQRAALPKKIHVFFPASEPDERIHLIARIRTNLTAATPVSHTTWNTYFRFLTNALPTDCRLHRANINPPPRRTNSLACHFCDDVEGDRLQHIYGQCSTITHALQSIARKLGIQLPVASTTQLCTLAYPPPAHKPTRLACVVFMMTFVWAVWSERTRYFSTLAHPPSQALVNTRLLDYITSHLPKGRAKRKTPHEVAVIANHPPPHALALFTDGSALGNPGPCGAGAYLILPNEAGTVTLSSALGHGDNNTGEVEGLRMGLELLAQAKAKDLFTGQPPLLIFTDSLVVMGALEWGWSLRNMPAGIRGLRRLYRAIKSDFPIVRLYWVKGHSDIEGNERADRAAKRGSQYSAQAPPGTQFPRTTTTWDTVPPEHPTHVGSSTSAIGESW